jgi:UPF0755 protein
MQLLVVALTFVCLPYALFFAPPLEYPAGTVTHIESGHTVGQIATELHDAHIIQSPFIFKALVYVSGGTIQAGSYSLPRQNVVTLVYRMENGLSGLHPLRVTIPEGASISEMAGILINSLGDFNGSEFIEQAKGKEGFLFPDTYFFLPGTPASVVIAAMSSQYESQVAPLRSEIAASGKTEKEIITMASILQKEARKPETMKIISGILWKRIKLGMPLQVDAVFGYIFNRPTYNPSLDDLKIDSPYNTYTNRGLPPGPIGNPGIDAILAALRPTETPYLYYLTGSDGVMYYAKTFEQHVANKVHLR